MLCLTKHFIIKVSTLPKHSHLQDRLWEKVIPIADDLMKSDSTSVVEMGRGREQKVPWQGWEPYNKRGEALGLALSQWSHCCCSEKAGKLKNLYIPPHLPGGLLGLSQYSRKVLVLPSSHPRPSRLPSRKEASQLFPDTFHFSHKLFQASFLLCACKALQYFTVCAVDMSST